MIPPEFTMTTLSALLPTTSSSASMLQRYLERDSFSTCSGPKDTRASLSGLPGGSAQCSRALCVSRMPWPSQSSLQGIGRTSRQIMQISLPLRKWWSIHLLVQHSDISLKLKKCLLTSATVYKHNARAIASVVLLWPGWVCPLLLSHFHPLIHFTQVATVASTCILWASHFHDDVYGPKTAHVRRQEEKGAEARRADSETLISTPSPEAPSPTHPSPTRQSALSAYRSGRWNVDR
jgi:hypothetical protein